MLTQAAVPCRVYGTPSYEVQKLFSQFQGSQFIRTDVDLKPEGPFHEWTLAASTTCQDADCKHLALKVIAAKPTGLNVPCQRSSHMQLLVVISANACFSLRCHIGCDRACLL